MIRLAAALSLLAVAAAFAAADPDTLCDDAAARAAVGDAAALSAKAATLASFSAPTLEKSQELCREAAALRIESGKDDGFLICAERPAGVSTVAVDLRALDEGAAQPVCDRLNECLFERHEQTKSALYAELTGAWDSLSCPGH